MNFSENLPETIEKEEINKLLKDGSSLARDKLVKHNLRLVLKEIYGKFKFVHYDREDLLSIGTIGLIKAIDTFDLEKGYEFSTYAVKCIDNEILLSLRKLKKDENLDYLDRVLFSGSDGEDITLKDSIAIDFDLGSNYEEEELRGILYDIINSCLSEKERKVIILCFGFNNGIVLKQKEVAKMFNSSESNISRLISKALKKIRKELEDRGYIELSNDKVLRK